MGGGGVVEKKFACLKKSHDFSQGFFNEIKVLKKQNKKILIFKAIFILWKKIKLVKILLKISFKSFGKSNFFEIFILKFPKHFLVPFFRFLGPIFEHLVGGPPELWVVFSLCLKSLASYFPKISILFNLVLWLKRNSSRK